MTARGWGPAPAWLGDDGNRAFAVTVCAAADIAPALGPLRLAIAGLAPRSERRLAASAAEIIVDCRAGEAWSLWQELRASLADVDVFVQPVDRPACRLLICDMDMTIVAAETLDEVAARLGFGDRIGGITARAMHGELDFKQALDARIALLAGQPEQVFHDVARELELNPGADRLIAGANAAGVHTVLISGGFSQIAEPVAQRLGFREQRCNRLEIEHGRLTGRVVAPIVDAGIKRDTLVQQAQALGIEPAACCAIGDGANDAPMIENAGLGIAYRGKPILRAATNCQINRAGLDAALYFMRLAGNQLKLE